MLWLGTGCQPLSATAELAGEAAGGEGGETRWQRGQEDALPPQHRAAAISDWFGSGWAAAGRIAG